MSASDLPLLTDLEVLVAILVLSRPFMNASQQPSLEVVAYTGWRNRLHN